MIEPSHLKFIKSLVIERNHIKTAKYLNSLANDFENNHLWEVDQFSMDLYSKELRRIKKVKYKGQDYFDYSKENEVIAKAQQGDLKSRQEVILNHLRFVIHIAKKYQNRGLPLNDLINEGNIGLIVALEKYDGSRGFSFRTYAKYYIINSIQTALNKYGTLIHYPANVSNIYKKVHRYIDKYQLMNDYLPSCDIIAQELNLDEEVVESCYEVIPTDLSLDEMSEYLGDLDLYDGFINSSMDTALSTLTDFEIDEDLEYESMVYDIQELLSQLIDREREIIQMVLGIGRDEIPLDEIAKHYNLSKERIRQIYEKAIRRLKGRFRYC